ncbi:MAG: endolytic transglycosylase MltG [Pseudomonadota bacterium]
MVVTIPKDASVRKISEILGEAGVLRDEALFGAISGPSLFRMQARFSGKASRLRFGEYSIPAESSVDDILALLSKGGNVFYQLTIPEGMTTAMALDRILDEERLSGELTEVPAEGSLLPETYQYDSSTSRSQLIAQMRTAMTTALDEAWAARDPSLPLKNKQEMLILASIVEKETRPNEHRKVASVFMNRLRQGWKLQTDPTVIYGITLGQGSLGRGLRKSELAAKTPYNTYVIEGLPPTPISNPGRESLMAVANPETTEYMFFVADGTGGHAFAKTKAEHDRNVAAWRRIERQRSQNQ